MNLLDTILWRLQNGDYRVTRHADYHCLLGKFTNETLERRLTKDDVIKYIQEFIEGTGGDWGWDDFISIQIKDKSLEAIRLTCGKLPDQYPPEKPNEYCNSQGIEVLRKIISDLRSEN